MTQFALNNNRGRRTATTFLFLATILLVIATLFITTTTATTTNDSDNGNGLLDQIALVSSWYEPGTDDETALPSSIMGMAYLRYEIGFNQPEHGLYPFSIQVEVEAAVRTTDIPISADDERKTGHIYPGIIISTQASPFFSGSYPYSAPPVMSQSHLLPLLEKKDNEITRLKELQQAFAVKVKKSISDAKTERDEALEQVDVKDKEKRRAEHELDAAKLRCAEFQKTIAQMKIDLAMTKESSHSLETAVSEEASLKKFHIQENLMLKKQITQVEQRWNDHLATTHQKHDRELQERDRHAQNLEAQLQQKANELQYYKENNQETVNKMGQVMAENQTLKMQLQQQSAMSLVAQQQPPMSIGSHYSSSSLSTKPSSLSMRSAVPKAPIYDDNDDEQTEQLPRPFAHSTNYSSSTSNMSSGLSSSPYKRMELNKPASAASSRPKPEVVKFVGSRTTRAAAARTRHNMNDENH